MENKRKLVITEYKYRSQCDTYMCKNQAKHSIGLENTPARATHNLCNECLAALAVILPKETIAHNPYVIELFQSKSALKKKLNEAAEKEAELIKQIDQLQQQLNKLTDISSSVKQDKGA